MSIYEFECYSCGQKFKFCKIHSNDVVKCSNCKETKLNKLILIGVIK